MKRLNFFLLLMVVFQSITLCQSFKIGYILTSSNDTIHIYNRDNNKTILTRLKKDCDCQKDSGSTFMYIAEDGKISKIKQSKIDEILIRKGARYCTEYKTRNPGSTQLSGAMGIKLPDDIELLSLPLKKNGKTKVLQSVLFSSSMYILTMHQENDMDYRIYIYSIPEKKLVEGRYHYYEVGYGKDGKRALSKIKQYFKGCSGIINEIENTIEQNKKVKRRKRIPALQNVTGMQCK